MPSSFFSPLARIRIFLESFFYAADRISPRLLPAELVILLAEAALYMWLFRDCSKKRAALYALAANLCSFLLGLYLAEPVWKLVVRTLI